MPATNSKYDHVVFSCDQGKLHLKLQGPWVRTSGMEPDVNQALALASELDAFKNLTDVEGDVKFYYTSAESDDEDDDAPDVMLNQIAIWSVTPDQISTVDVDDGDGGTQPQTKVTAYLVVFADARRKYVWPRGGMLNTGEVNKEPFQLGGADDDNGQPVFNPQQLANACLDAMGLPKNAPNSLSDYPQPRNMNWRASHAPTELARILSASNHRAFVDQFGDLQIREIGHDDLPTWPEDRLIVNTSRPLIDMRAQVVIVTSAPMAIMETLTITGLYDPNDTSNGDPLDPSAPAKWEFVCRDKQGRWKPLNTSGWFDKETPQDAVRNKFKNIDPSFRWQVETDTYYCLRLRPSKSGPSPVERFVYDADPNDQSKKTVIQRPITIQAKVADLDEESGLWSNLKDYKTFAAAFVAEGQIIQSTVLLGKLPDGENDVSLIEHFTALSGDDLKIQCSREMNDYDPNSSPPWKPRYYMYGIASGGSSRLSDDEVKVAIHKPDTVVVRRPELRPLLLEGEFQGIKDIDDRAGLVSGAYNRRPSAPPSKRVMIKGYYAAELSGRVERVEFDPQALLTRIDIDMFWMPGATYLPAAIAFDRPLQHEKHPGQLATASARTASGSAGYTQPTALLTLPTPTPTPTLRWLKITDYDPSLHPAFITGTPCDPSGNTFGATNTTSIAVGVPGPFAWEMPPLVYELGSVVPYVPLPSGSQFGTLNIGNLKTQCNGLLMSPCFKAPCFMVSLVKVDGSAGDGSHTCSFVYDLYGWTGPVGVGGPVLAYAAAPMYSGARVFNMTASPAAFGIATIVPNGGYVLAVAFETAAGTQKC